MTNKYKRNLNKTYIIQYINIFKCRTYLSNYVEPLYNNTYKINIITTLNLKYKIV